MSNPCELDVVRVAKLMKAKRRFVGSPRAMREPRVGDVGTIVHISCDTEGKNAAYTVECVATDGRTTWLADFLPEEVELIQAVK